MTQGDIITSVLVLLNEMAPGETPNADELYDGCDRFNTLLAAWQLIEQHVFVIQNFSNALSSGTGTYTMGTGGDFNTARPVKIESAGIIRGGVRTPIEIWDSKKWASIRDKAASAKSPEGVYNDNAYPLANINVWPVPNDTSSTLDLYLWGEFTAFTNYKYTDLVIDGVTNTKVTSAARPFTAADVNNYINVANGVSGFTAGRYQIASVLAGAATLSAAVGTIGSTGGVATYDQTADYPPGYLKAIRYNLAVDIAPEYGRQQELGAANDPASIAGIALNSLAALRALNASNEAGTEGPPTVPPAPTVPQRQ